MKNNIRMNCKGFMLVEVIVVTVVVATIMVSLYVAFNRVYAAYDLKESYTNIDAVYGIKAVEDYFIDNMQFNILVNNINATTPYVVFKDESGDKCNCFSGSKKTYCEKIFTTYNINSLYLVKLVDDPGDPSHTKKVLPNLSSLSVNHSFKDYFDYINNAVSLEGYSYIFLVETYEIDSDTKILNKYGYLMIK